MYVCSYSIHSRCSFLCLTVLLYFYIPTLVLLRRYLVVSYSAKVFYLVRTYISTLPIFIFLMVQMHFFSLNIYKFKPYHCLWCNRKIQLPDTHDYMFGSEMYFYMTSEAS